MVPAGQRSKPVGVRKEPFVAKHGVHVVLVDA